MLDLYICRLGLIEIKIVVCNLLWLSLCVFTIHDAGKKLVSDFLYAGTLKVLLNILTSSS